MRLAMNLSGLASALGRAAAICSAIWLPVAANAAPDKTAVLVVQEAAAPEAVTSDAKAAAHLKSLGYAVRVIDQSAPAAAAGVRTSSSYPRRSVRISLPEDIATAQRR